MWWCQFIDWSKFETRPSSLRNFGMSYYLCCLTLFPQFPLLFCYPCSLYYLVTPVTSITLVTLVKPRSRRLGGFLLCLRFFFNRAAMGRARFLLCTGFFVVVLSVTRPKLLSARLRMTHLTMFIQSC